MQEFDYIIVGAGSAGCVVANRLTASGQYSVLLLEAGGTDRRFFVQMPLGYGKTFFDARINWKYQAEPDPGLAGNADWWPRGKLLGGSSSINAMVWIRGQRADYDGWRAAGNVGWGFDDLLPVFRAIEHDQAGDEMRGKGGPVHVSDITPFVHPLVRSYLQAAQQAGLPDCGNLSSGDSESAGIYQINTKGGRRMSSARAFLRPALRRSNLKLVTNALAARVTFDGKRATGVEYGVGNRRLSARVRREVILCGGSVNSPQLLELSGIGDPAILGPLGIETLHANRHVGSNLADHLGINYTWKARIPTLNQILRPWWGKLAAGSRYLLMGSGPLSMGINQGGGFFRTGPDQPRPNMQLYFQAFSTVIPKPGERPILTPDPWPGYSIGLSNCRPTSRGSIHIRSREPSAPPRITANAFSTAHDVDEMLAAVKFLRRIASQPALADLTVEEVLPGSICASDGELVDDFRRRSGTVYHPVSTCRMGPDAALSVVDPRLRVHGVDGLRVIDASVFPEIISANTNATAMAIGAKGADLVLEDAR
ncbi:GMC family oxidoreductase N-terminal domain-containing protein [Mesorhizobium sp. Z1-4]|uniref:GMC family oxidoreductase n=1 Tax=Mesorhizobium sp. Z1-4 TaxID=2448478 RepID=UPI000FDC9E5D|nr:GMC family oxidoreductase N-terminal domain-containing protein [Mesorhizobium sp. Z1-4]